MISFSLRCANDHRFDSWFQSGDAFEKLRTAGLVSCAICGETDVQKAVMAPRVRPARAASDQVPDRAPHQASGQASDQTPAPSAKPPSLRDPGSPAEQALSALRRKIQENSEYVGPDFAREARAMHDGDTPERPIYGEAKPDDARRLIEDGIPVLPLPFLPGRKTN